MIEAYILVDRKPVPATATEWLEWCHNDRAESIVQQTQVNTNVFVSTVFLGFDHNLKGNGDPLLFETQVFGGDHDGDTRRCSTWEQAEQIHAEVLKEVQNHD